MIIAKHHENFQEKDDWGETDMHTYTQAWDRTQQKRNTRHQLNNNYLLQ